MAKRLAIVSSGVASPLSSALEFAIRARSLGYEIGVFAPKSSAEMIDYCGVAHYVIPEPRINAFAPLLSKAERRAMTRTDRREASVQALRVEQFAESLRVFQPDVVFIDCEMHAQIIVAMSLDFPVVQFSNMFLSPPGPSAPPLNKRAFPGRGLRGSKLGVSVLWGRFLLWKLLKLLRKRIREGGADYASAHIELARRLNVPIARRLRLICWQMPWTYKLPTALLLPRAMDLPTRLYGDFNYLGPMVLRDRPEKEYDHESVERFCTPQADQKRIFVGFGTIMKLESDLLPNLWAVARKHPEWQFLFAAGQNWEDGSDTQLPTNVQAVAWVPQHKVLEHADLAIMHGGTGGFVEAVQAGTPVLLYPHVNDQHGSAARAVFHGIGRAGRRDDPVEKIEADILALLESPAVKDNCNRLRAACQEEMSTDALASFLKQLPSNEG